MRAGDRLAVVDGERLGSKVTPRLLDVTSNQDRKSRFQEEMYLIIHTLKKYLLSANPCHSRC